MNFALYDTIQLAESSKYRVVVALSSEMESTPRDCSVKSIKVEVRGARKGVVEDFAIMRVIHATECFLYSFSTLTSNMKY
jgi:hypothetical protein